jgi:hypothetical protein
MCSMVEKRARELLEMSIEKKKKKNYFRERGKKIRELNRSFF